MADKMMRVAGRNPSGNAVAMKADADGNIGTTRKWNKNWSTIVAEMEITDTNLHILGAFDVSNSPVVSLRILNRLGVPITLSLHSDMNTTNGAYLLDKDNNHAGEITVQATQSHTIVTPDDIPIMNYVRYLKIGITAQSAPSSGTISVYAVTMG